MQSLGWSSYTGTIKHNTPLREQLSALSASWEAAAESSVGGWCRRSRRTTLLHHADCCPLPISSARKSVCKLIRKLWPFKDEGEKQKWANAEKKFPSKQLCTHKNVTPLRRLPVFLLGKCLFFPLKEIQLHLLKWTGQDVGRSCTQGFRRALFY